MARYHFNIRNGTGFTADEEGRELPDHDAARAEALRGIRSMAAEEVLEGRLDLSGSVEVTDEDGRDLFTVAFEDAIDLIRRPGAADRR